MKSFNKKKKLKRASKGRWYDIFFCHYLEIYVINKKRMKTVNVNKMKF